MTQLDLLELQRELKQTLNEFEEKHKMQIEEIRLVKAEKYSNSFTGIQFEIVRVEVLVKV